MRARLLIVLCAGVAGCGASDPRDDAVAAAQTWFEALKAEQIEKACTLQLPTAAGSIRDKYLAGESVRGCPDVMRAYRARLSDKAFDTILEAGFETEGEIKRDKLGVYPKAKAYEISVVLMQRRGDAWKVAAVAIPPDGAGE